MRHIKQLFKSTNMNILFLLGFIFLFGCSQSEDSNNEIDLISPVGYVLAGSINDLAAVIDLDDASEIIDIDFMESGQASIGFISYRDKSGKTSNVALGCGKINFESVSLNVQPILKSSNGQIKVSCSGCENCRVMGEISSDGTITVKCESSCCSMIIDSPRIPQN